MNEDFIVLYQLTITWSGGVTEWEVFGFTATIGGETLAVDGSCTANPADTSDGDKPSVEIPDRLVERVTPFLFWNIWLYSVWLSIITLSAVDGLESSALVALDGSGCTLIQKKEYFIKLKML